MYLPTRATPPPSSAISVEHSAGGTRQCPSHPAEVCGARYTLSGAGSPGSRPIDSEESEHSRSFCFKSFGLTGRIESLLAPLVSALLKALANLASVETDGIVIFAVQLYSLHFGFKNMSQNFALVLSSS